MVSLEEKTACLTSVEMFEGAEPKIVEELAKIAEPVDYPGGTELITQGKKCPNLYILTSGEFGIYIREGEESRLVASLSDCGKVVGEIGAVSGLAATATVSVLSESASFLKLEGQQFHRIISVEPKLAATILRSLARYLKG